MSRLHGHAAVLLAVWLAGCASVPDVTFESDAASDSRVDASGRPDDAAVESDVADGSSGPGDAGAADADAAGDVGTDGAPDASCPVGIPAGAAWCCGPVPCRGTASACQSECTNCENDCPGQTCCLDKHGNYQGCAATPGACP